VEFPVDVALAELVPQLPTGPRWWYEVKLDGHRTVLWRLAETVRLQARSGRDVTTPWMDLAVAGMALPPGVVLDGEAVVVVDGRVSFEAAQARAASSPARSRELAARHPALLIVWDVLSLPTGDVRGRPYEERGALMLDVVAGLPEGSPIQAVSATEDVEVARVWYETLAGSGVEGVVAKSGRSPYRAGRSSSWSVDCTNPLYAVVWSSIRKASPCGSGSQRTVGRTRWPGACRPGRSHRTGEYAVPRP
jgi:ATP-dependent DNA ligase